MTAKPDLSVLSVVPIEDQEMPFVLDAWSRSMRDSPWAGNITNDRWSESCRTTISALLDRGAKILVVVPEEGLRRVIGFLCIEAPDLIHYFYVKRSFRGLGIARMLQQRAKLELGLSAPGRFTHRTRACGWLIESGWTFDPIPTRTKEVHGQSQVRRDH